MPWEGHPQGVPLPIVLSRRYALGGHPQGAPQPIVLSRRLALGRAPTRGAPTIWLLSALCPGKGTHKGCPYRLSCLGAWPWEGHPQGVPLPFGFSRRLALGRAPTRGAPTIWLLSALGPGKSIHKGRPFRLSCLGGKGLCPGRAPTRGAPTDLSCLGAWPWEGHPQGVPLPFVLSRRLALGRAPTRGAPTDWEGHPQGVPYHLLSRRPCPYRLSRRLALGRAPTRGAPTDCLVSALCPGKGTHKGCPYRLSCLGAWPWEGHPQGVPLPFGLSRRLALGRAPTRGAPTIWSPLPIVLSRRLALGRAPTRGAPTICLRLGVWPWEGHPQGVPLPLSCLGAWPWDCLLTALCPGKGTHKGCPYR